MHKGIQHLKAVSLEDHVPLRKVFVSNDKSRILRFTHMGGHTDSSMGAANLGWFPCDGNHDATEGHRPPYRPRLNHSPGPGAPQETTDLGDSEGTVRVSVLLL